MKTLTRYVVVAMVVLGLAMVGIGGIFVAKGLDVKAEIQAELLQEQVTTGQDASIPGVMVQDSTTAKAQQDAITAHTYGEWGPYSGLDREDPRRDVYLKGLTLRNSLNLAIMGFGVADLAIGTGVIAIVLGLAMTGFAIPIMYVMKRSEMVTGQSSDARDAPGTFRPYLEGGMASS